MTDQAKEPAAEAQVSIYNRGLRTFHLPGGIIIEPGKSAMVPKSLADHFISPNGYSRELVDAASIAPGATSVRTLELESEKAALKKDVQALTEGLTGAQKENADLKAVIEAGAKENAELKAQVESLTSQLEAFQSKGKKAKE